jgi:ATP-binding cassette subfamily B protein
MTPEPGPARSPLKQQLFLIYAAFSLLRSPGMRSLLTLSGLAALRGLVPVAAALVTARAVDRLLPAVSSAGAGGTLLPFTLWALLAGSLLLLWQMLGTATARARAGHEERLKSRIIERIHAQSARLDLAFYESPALFDRLHQAREEARYRPAELCRNLVTVLEAAVTLAGLAVVLLAFGAPVVLALVASGLPVVYVAVRQARKYKRWLREVGRASRRAWYYDQALTSSEYAPELRMYGWGPEFQEEHRELRERLQTEERDLRRRHGRADAIGAFASLSMLGGACAWVVRQAIAGAMSIGQLASFGQALVTGLAAIRSFVSGLRGMYENSLFIEDLAEFLAMEPEVVSPKAPAAAPARVAQGIRFKDVTFRYPGAARPTLDGFNLFIPAGQRAAIVGPNGAGKSTLIKLLCRLYDPDEGAIEIDGVDIRTLDLAQLRAMISPLFQNPARYFQTAWDNLTIGTREGELSPQYVQRASVAAGASAVIMGLPRGYNTVLGSWFEDGTELSIGEWQRVALARAIVRPAPIVILDEPTSALDPWTEAHWYPRFCEVVSGRTAVIITHRFTTAMMTDIIHVIEQGRVIESGDHAALLALGGRYAYAWTATHTEPQRFAPAAVPAARAAS